MKFVKVVSKRVARTTELPGEVYPFLSVQLHAKVPSYVEKVLVDRGSFVKPGDLLIQLSAPEMMAHISQAEAQLTSAESDEAQAEAQLAAAQSTYRAHARGFKDAWHGGGKRYRPGETAERSGTGVSSFPAADGGIVNKSNLKSQQDLAAYLRVTAPFDGVISTRLRTSRGARWPAPTCRCYNSIRSRICGLPLPFRNPM